MAFVGFIKEYQTLIGSFLGVIFPIGLWFVYKFFEKREAEKESKKEVEKIFLRAVRECEDSIKNMTLFAEKLQKNIKINNTSFDVILPPQLNRIEISNERLAILSKNLHHIISQQIDIAISEAKKFNGWLEQYEKMPVFIFDANIKVLQAGLQTKETVVKEYYKDLIRYADGVMENLQLHSRLIQLHLLRPVMSIQAKAKDLERLFITNGLEDFLDTAADAFLFMNKGFQ